MFGSFGEEGDIDYGNEEKLKTQLEKLFSAGTSFLALIEGELSPPSDMYEDHNYYDFEFALKDTEKLLENLK